MANLQQQFWDLNDWDVLIWAIDAEGDLRKEIKRGKGDIFRRAYIKRRNASDGLFESEWQEITNDVKSWGSIRYGVDHQRHGKMTFDNVRMTVANIDGSYNPEDNSDSLWFGYANQQRSLFKIEAGFQRRMRFDNGIRTVTEYPSDPTQFVGILSGDLYMSSKNEVAMTFKPLTQVFQDFPVNALPSDVFTSSGMTAQLFFEGIRDATDGAGSYIFRPFFNDTTTYWSIASTTNTYDNLNTSTAIDVAQRSVWDVMERLAQAEDHIAYVSPTGVFRFVPKTVGDSATYEIFGVGTHDTEWGTTLKQIHRYGKKLTNFYSRASVKFRDTLAAEGFAATGTAFAINGTNTAWNLGHRTFSIENLWITNTTTANSIVNTLFNNVSSLDEEINFSTSLIVGVNLLDRIQISYDARDTATRHEFWDISKWDTELVWFSNRGDAINLDATEFKVLSININLDSLETRFIARQL